MHHAQLLLGSYTWACTILPELVRIPGPDIVHLTGDRMGVEEVRNVIHDAYLMPIVSAERVFVLAYGDITREAQNALLKIVEEPPKTARFYIVTERKETLIPTLLSRLVEYGTEDTSSIDLADFFGCPIGDQIREIGVRLGKKDEVWARKLLGALEERAYQDKKYDMLTRLNDLRVYFDAPSASKKMILEHLVLMA
jgi:hypothetical protein